MSVADKIDKFLEEYEIEDNEGSNFSLKGLLLEASKEIKALTKDGETLLYVIADKDHNASVMRKRIADLEKKIKELKK